MHLVVLAGGLGTRLSTVFDEGPKALAPIMGRPFIFFLIDYWRLLGVEHISFVCAHKSDQLIDAVTENYRELRFNFLVEDNPAGTAHALQYALKEFGGDFFISNGDTLLTFDRGLNPHPKNSTIYTCFADSDQDFGRIEVCSSSAKVTNFLGKSSDKTKMINTGVMFISAFDASGILTQEPPSKDAEDMLWQYFKCSDEGIDYINVNGYFLDIGRPADYSRAQHEIPEILEKI